MRFSVIPVSINWAGVTARRGAVHTLALGLLTACGTTGPGSPAPADSSPSGGVSSSTAPNSTSAVPSPSSTNTVTSSAPGSSSSNGTSAPTTATSSPSAAPSTNPTSDSGTSLGDASDTSQNTGEGSPTNESNGSDTGEPSVTPGSGTSAGCGKTTSLQSGSATIDVGGVSREYILQMPSNYDSSKPYKLVFGWHWMGGSAADVATGGSAGLGNYYGLEALAEGTAIFVAPNGIDNGWANTGSRDINFLKAMLATFESELCIDLGRIFSTGFSYGGMMSFAIACEMGDVFRAMAPLSGALYSGCGNGTAPIAMWGAHGISDEVVPLSDGRKGLEEVLERNNCGTETTPTAPDSCVTYSGCDEGYPVTWCEFDGGHSPQRWQSQPIWDFFSQF